MKCSAAAVRNSICPLATVLTALLGWVIPLRAAEPDLVGVLALAVEDAVVDELQLTEGQRKSLLEVIDAREGDAVDLVLRVKGLPLEERSAQLEAFRRESEARGLALLTSQQRHRLEAIRLRRLGLAALGEPKVADRLHLTAQQRKEIGELLKDYRIPKGPGAPSMPGPVEQALAKILQPEQRGEWDSLRKGEEVPTAMPAESRQQKAAPSTEAATKNSQPPTTAEAAKAAEPPEASGAVPVASARQSPATSKPGSASVTEELKLPDDTVRLRFNFRFQPWKDVLDWFAQQAGLSLVLDAPPPGSFNYIDDRPYSPAEAIDLLNSVLLTKGYALVRRERMLMLVNLQDGIPANLVPVVATEDLARRGEFEVVSVIFDLERLSPEEAEAEIKKLLGPQGSIVVLGQARQVQVTDTAGRLRNIGKMLRRIEEPEGPMGQVRSYALRQAVPQQVLDVMRQLLDIPPDRTSAADGSVRFAIDTASQRLIVTGKPEKLARVEEILKTLDIPVSGEKSGGVSSPQLEVYPIVGSDPESVLKVMQTLLAGQPEVRLSLDPKAGTLVALARPDQHATIRATLEQMQRDGRKVEVISLRRMDPQLAVAAITKIFAEAGGQPPQVDADVSGRQLLVRGTGEQVSQIRTLLEKMGEGAEGKGPDQASTIRLLPLYGRNVKQALDRAQEIWPSLHENKIRVVTPGAVINELRPSQDDESSDSDGPGSTASSELLRRLMQPPAKPVPAAVTRQPADAQPAGSQPSVAPGAARPSSPATRTQPQPEGGKPPAVPDGRRTGRPAARIHLVSQQAEKADQPSEETAPLSDARKKAKPQERGGAAPILVAPGPGGILIASEDVDALDAFEQLLTQLGSGAIAGNSQLTIFYLKHAKAAAVAETIDQIFGGGTLSSGGGAGGGGGSLLGDLAGAALGEAGGGMVSALLGLGGGSVSPSGAIRITPDSRLNALVVQANPADVDIIQELLKILDRKGSPEDVGVEPKPRIVPVFHTAAADLAEIIKQVYQDRMTSGGAAGNRPSSPQEFFAMLRGGSSRRGGSSSRNQAEEIQKMSVGVDDKTNSLVVVAPDPLFQEVKQLVEQLDEAAIDSSQTMRVVTLERASLSAVQRALTAMMGPSVQTSSSTRRTGTPTAGGAPGSEAASDGRMGFPFPGFPGFGFGGPGSSFGFGRFGGGPSGPPQGPSSGPGPGAGPPSSGSPSSPGPSSSGRSYWPGRSYGGRSSRGGGEPGR